MKFKDPKTQSSKTLEVNAGEAKMVDQAFELKVELLLRGHSSKH